MTIAGQHVRIVWFPQHPSNILLDSAFAHITGQVPDSTQVNRSQSPSTPTVSQATKLMGALHIDLRLSAARLELALRPGQLDGPLAIPTIDIAKALEKAKNMVTHAQSLPPSLRISCIVTTVNLANSRNDAKRLFTSFIDFDPKIDDSIDELFQINRRTNFADVVGNRFMRISVAEITGIQIDVGTTPQPPITHIQYALSTTYDFNTLPDGNVLDETRQKTIFESIFSSMLTAINQGNLKFLRSQ